MDQMDENLDVVSKILTDVNKTFEDMPSEMILICHPVRPNDLGQSGHKLAPNIVNNDRQFISLSLFFAVSVLTLIIGLCYFFFI